MPTSLKGMSAIQSLFVIVYGFGCFYCVGNEYFSLINSIREIIIHVLQPEINVNDIATIRSMCNNFLVRYQQLMGEDYMTHNTHLFKHLYRDIYLYGPSWTHCMFQFEGFNHDINNLQTSSSNFYKRVILNYNEQSEAESMVKKIIVENVALKAIYEKLIALKEKTCPYFLINGYFFPKRIGQYSNYVQLRNGKIGEIIFKESDNLSLKIFFRETDLNNMGRHFSKVEIYASDVVKQVILTRKLFKIDEDDFQVILQAADVLRLRNFF